ncbi:MAG: hypothetical protein EPN36_04290 [Rhodanobacteraceae bacterium]|nr:MAG: hypothetical protein EPN36_04290 [Rhodanobacteraceae bacterium]
MSLSVHTRKWLPWLLLAIAVLATAAVYWPGRTGGWVFDDYPNIVDNAAIHITPGHSTLVAWVNSALSSPASFLRRPLASLTFSVNWYFGGGNPWDFKVTNIAIHLVNGVLLFVMLRALLRLLALRSGIPRLDDIPPALRADPLRSEGGEHDLPLPREGGSRGMRFLPIDESAATRLALIVAAAWMLLPINLMAVLYVVQRMESLCQVFVLAGLWAYLHGRWMMLTAGDDAKRDRRGFGLAVAGIVLGTCIGLTSKETAVLLPVFAFLAEWVVVGSTRNTGSHPPQSPFLRKGEDHPLPEEGGRAQRGGMPAHADKRIWTLFTVTLFVPAVLGFLWLLRSALRASSWSGRDFTLAQRLLTEPRVLVDYLHWTLFPNPDVLSLYHDEIVKSTGLLTPWTTLGSIVLLLALLIGAIWLRKRKPLVSLGILWFFAGNLLTATIIPLELVYEQRMYFASIGVLLAVGTLLLGLRWKIAWPLLRGFLVAVALLWFAVATNLRAQEWSNPLRLAIAEANRHPESARAVYEAGRLLLIASNYQPGKTLDASWKYLREAAAIPGSSSLPDQAMIMITDHDHQGTDADYWNSMIHKLRDQPTRQEDISALISLTNCYGASICKFDVSWLQRAYAAALSRPHPIARLDGAYADFLRDILHDNMQAEVYLARAVAGAPSESAYRVDLAALYARNGQTEKALEQIDALRRLNYAGRLDGQIATLERLTEQGSKPARK